MFFFNIIDLNLKVSRVMLKKSKIVKTKLASFKALTKQESLPVLDLKNEMTKRSNN